MSEKEIKPVPVEDIPKDIVKGMKRKHILFSTHYFMNDNSTKSAELAGSKPQSARTAGYRLLKRDDVQGLLAWLGQYAIQNSELDPEWVLERLKNVAEYGLQTVRVLGQGGRDTGRTEMRDTTASIRALELLGKYQNMWGGELVQVDASTKTLVLDAGGVMDRDTWERLAEKYIPASPR